MTWLECIGMITVTTVALGVGFCAGVVIIFTVFKALALLLTGRFKQGVSVAWRATKDWPETRRRDCLFSTLVKLTNRENSEGRWRVILEYDNSGDTAMILDGDGYIIASCGIDEADDEDNETRILKQFETAVGKVGA